MGHLISGGGIEPIPENLDSIKNMLAPQTRKEVKQFLGLIGYYRKFIPKFSDVALPLTNLTKRICHMNGPQNVIRHLKC